ncbi:AAA family ATPase [Streptomyces sp. NPDC047002]|uniref:AAA family ATPase n=1 Tax=Streptomyces sp. NPDC047002 TaxID=3155475 RepID=UPI003456737E
MEQAMGASEDDWHLPVWGPPAGPAPSGDQDDGFPLQDPPAAARPAGPPPAPPIPAPAPLPAPGQAPAAPVPGPPPGGPAAGHPPGPRAGRQAAPQRPAESTGHVTLPPGGPVPVHGAAPEGGTGTATLAVLLIGPAGAGKTTVARHWARTRRVPTAHISLDDVREWVCSGFADPQSGWNEHSEAQYRLARRTCGFAARNFLANGISCILDDAVFPDRPVVGLGGWKRHVGPGLLPVVLLPGLEVVLERNAKREGNRRLADEEVAGIHGRMAGWYGSGLPIIDNSTLDVPTTARLLDDVLAQSVASPPAW